jgi:hypothetical protein
MDYPVLNEAPDVAPGVAVGYLDAGGNFIPAAAAAPLPVTGVALGAIADAAITDPTASGSLVALLKGLLTKTTFMRSAISKGTIAFNSTSYDAVVQIGGLVIVATGLPAGTVIRLDRLYIHTRQAVVITAQSLIAYVYDANPSGSTIADHTALALAAADEAKVATHSNPAAFSPVGGACSWGVLSAATPCYVTIDGSGNFYFSVASNAASLVFAGAGSLKYRAEYAY